MIVKKGDKRFNVEVSNVTEDEYTIKCVESTAREDISTVSAIVVLGLIAILIAGIFVKDDDRGFVMGFLAVALVLELIIYLLAANAVKQFSIPYSETFKINGRLSESELEKSIDKVITNVIEMKREEENKAEVRENNIEAINEAMERVRQHKKDK